jgi:class 3 adenylate cyclase
MTKERAKRKLSGILSADAVGYSRLMEEDETSTIRNLEDSKKLMSTLIEQFQGRVVDAPGDNLLAEFGSVVDATECAVHIQQELKTRNADLPDNRRMEFPIGVNLGDMLRDNVGFHLIIINAARNLTMGSGIGGSQECWEKTKTI